MPQIVFKVKKDEIQLLKTLLSSKSDIEELRTTNPYEVFRVKYDNCLIVGYVTGKIVANKEIGRQLFSELLPKITRETTKATVIGSDEAGKGEWLGPIVVAAVAVKPEQIYELQVHGVMDSKELALSRIRELARIIRDQHYLRSHVMITPKRFNELFDELKDEKKTLNDLLAWSHAKVIDELLKSLPKGKEVRVIIDEFDKIKTEERLRRVLDLKQIDVIQRPKAEENISVAAASIIARDLREDYLDYLSEKLQTNLRAKTINEAKSDKKAAEYAKVSYLKTS